MPIFEPKAFANEEAAFVPVVDAVCMALSGYARFSSIEENDVGGPSSSDLRGSEDSDRQWEHYEVHMTVGPKWRNVERVSPIVTVAGFTFSDSDTADASGCTVDTCTWDTVGLTGNETNLERIRLKVNLRIRGGEGYSVTKLAYHLIAVGLFPDF